jgi:hypothetical protein
MLPSAMTLDGKNEHKRNRGKARLAIPSRSNHSQCVIPPNDSSEPRLNSAP